MSTTTSENHGNGNGNGFPRHLNWSTIPVEHPADESSDRCSSVIG